MDKIYEYKTKQYNYKIRDIGIFAIFFLVWSLVNFFSKGLQIIWLVAIIICAYIIWENFISLSNPKIVHITDDFISFSAFNKIHTYKWCDIRKFTIKELISSRKMYIRINNDNILRGRYWINCFFMNDCDELYFWLRNKEMELNPNSMKTQSIKHNEEEFKKRQAERQAKKEEKEKLKELRKKHNSITNQGHVVDDNINEGE